MPKIAKEAAAAKDPRSRKSWAPNSDDHFIYWWVKFQGQTQSWVARQVGLSQGTISRMIQRYERWQARADAQADGRLSPAERVRAQRWLTFERNELILSSCLRIAGEMEGVVDASKSTFLKPMGQPSAEREIRTEWSTRDRHGLAARFLRLAYRINMDQLKLAEQCDLPPLPPLSADEIAAEEANAARTSEELDAARAGGRNEFENQEREEHQRQAEIVEEDRREQERLNKAAELRQIEEAERLALAQEILKGQEPVACGQEPENSDQPSSDSAGAHNAHSPCAPETSATDDAASTCAANGRPKKPSRYARIDASAKPNGKPKTRQRGQRAAVEMRITPERSAATVDSP